MQLQSRRGGGHESGEEGSRGKPGASEFGTEPRWHGGLDGERPHRAPTSGGGRRGPGGPAATEPGCAAGSPGRRNTGTTPGSPGKGRDPREHRRLRAGRCRGRAGRDPRGPGDRPVPLRLAVPCGSERSRGGTESPAPRCGPFVPRDWPPPDTPATGGKGEDPPHGARRAAPPGHGTARPRLGARRCRCHGARAGGAGPHGARSPPEPPEAAPAPRVRPGPARLGPRRRSPSS